jgi:hypothetical protein
MSSARSNAAARNKRASTPLPQAPGRQQQQQQRPAQAPSQGQQSKTRQAGTSLKNVPKKYPQLSISDAIGLITLRLGRVEQIVKQLQVDSAEDNLSMCDGNSINGSLMIDGRVIQDIIGRISNIESNGQSLSSAEEDKETIRQLQLEIAENKKVCTTLQLSCLELNTQLMQLLRVNASNTAILPPTPPLTEEN